MQTLHPALLLHLGAVLLFAATLLVPRLRRYAGLAPIPLVASWLLLLRAGGWVDMPARVVALGLLLLLPWAACRCRADFSRHPGKAAGLLAAGARLLYAGFLLALGLQSLRNGTPLMPPLAFQALLLGALLLLPPEKLRLLAVLALLLLLAAAVAGATSLCFPAAELVRPASAP